MLSLLGRAIQKFRVQDLAGEVSQIVAPAVVEASRFGESGDVLVWSRASFFNGDGSWTPCPSVIDVTGAPRFLCYGPGVQLEPGLWRVQVSFELCPDAARRFYLVQFGAGADYTTVESDIGRAGRNRVEIEHRLSGSDPVFVRIWIARAAFHGDFKFLEARAQLVEPL